MKIDKRVLLAGVMAAAFTGVLQASDIDIKLNGDFKGAAIGAATVPGWKICGKAGSSRIVAGAERDEFGMALSAAADQPIAASTGLIPVRGKYLEFEADVRGAGQSAVVVRAFGADRKALNLETKVVHDPAAGTKMKFVCNLSEAANGFICIALTAMPGANVIFEDVDAEFRNGLVIGSLPLIKSGDPACGSANCAAVCKGKDVPDVKELLDDSFFAAKSIGNELYQISIPAGSDVDFELEEGAEPQNRWRIASADMTKTRVELKHDSEGVWPFRTCKAEIEIKAIAKGESKAVFTAPGKSFTVIVKAY